MRIYSKFSGHATLIDCALTYLPNRKRFKLGRFVSSIVTMYGNNGCCFDLSEKRVIFISEEIIPDKGIWNESSYYKWFIYTVLHESAHAILKHKPTVEDDPRHIRQENHAKRLAMLWLNHSEQRRGMTETTCEEIQTVHNEVVAKRKKIRIQIDAILQPLARP